MASEEEQCRLMGGLGVAVQCLLGAGCVAALAAKWRCEPRARRRSCRAWSLDASKQLVGAAWVHVLNLAQAFLFEALRGAQEPDECAWYLIGVFCDCVLSTVICWRLVRLLRPLLRARLGVNIGEYGGDGRGGLGSEACGRWALQTLIWLALVTWVRAMLCCGVWTFRGTLQRAAHEALRPLDGQPGAQVVVTLVLVPLVGDLFQFWVQDSFLKKQDPGEAKRSGSKTGALRNALLGRAAEWPGGAEP